MASDGSFQPVQMPDYGQTMQTILGLQRGRQALQTGQYIQDKAQADSEQATASNNALQNVQRMTLEGAKQGKWLTKDGDFDPDGYAKDANAVGGIYAADAIKNYTENARNLTLNQKAVSDLTDSQRARLGSGFGALATKPDLSLQDIADEASNQMAVDKSPGMRRLATTFLAHLPNTNDPKQLQEFARRASLAGTDTATAAAASNPNVGTMQGPQGLTPVNTNPNAPGGTGPVGAPMPQGIAPGYTTAPNGQLVRTGNNGVQVAPMVQTGPGASSQAAPPRNPPPNQQAPESASDWRRTANSGAPAAKPRTAADDAPSPNAPQALQDAYRTSVAQAKQTVQSARDNDQDYGTNVHISNVIRTLAKNTTTGPGTDTWHTMLAGVPGAVSSTASDAGSDYQTIGAMLERQSASARATMGLPNTNAGQGAAEKASGTTQYTPQTLATKNNLTQSLVEGAHKYREGLEKVGGFTTAPSPTAVANFQKDWTANFDPNVYRAIRAHNESDADEQNALRKELGPQGFKALAAKARNLESLSSTGHLPGGQ